MSSRQHITIQTAALLKPISQASAGFITDSAWSPDGSALAVSHGETVSLWIDGFRVEPNRKLAHPAPVKGVAFTPDGTALATASSDMLVRLWSTLEDLVLITLRGHHDSVEDVVFSPNGRLLASGGGDQTIRIVDMTDSIGSTVLNGHTNQITSMAFNRDGKICASGGWDNTLRFWDIESKAERSHLKFGDWIRELVATPSGEFVAAACKDGKVYIVEFATCRIAATLEAHEGGADSLTFSPDGSILATGGRDNQIRLWDWRKAPEQPLTTLDGHTKPVLTLAFHPVGTLLVSGGGDNVVKVWSVDGEENM